MKIHPAANVFPEMGAAEFDQLKADIEAHGLQAPVEIYEGQILDGRHRYRACKALRITPDVVTVETDDPFAYVVSANLHRRHLTTSQRAMVAVNVMRAMEAEAESRMKAGTLASIDARVGNVHNSHAGTLAQNCARVGKSSEHAARAVGVSARSVESAAKVAANAAKPVVEAVKAGKVSVAKAEKIVKATPKKSEQAKLLKKAVDDPSFDPADFVETTPARPPKPGKPVVTTKQRKEALALYGKLCRALDAVGIYDEFIGVLNKIGERLEQV